MAALTSEVTSLKDQLNALRSELESTTHAYHECNEKERHAANQVRELQSKVSNAPYSLPPSSTQSHTYIHPQTSSLIHIRTSLPQVVDLEHRSMMVDTLMDEKRELEMSVHLLKPLQSAVQNLEQDIQLGSASTAYANEAEGGVPSMQARFGSSIHPLSLNRIHTLKHTPHRRNHIHSSFLTISIQSSSTIHCPLHPHSTQ